MEEESKTFFLLSAKVLFLSWILQIVFAIWVFAMFVIFASADYGTDELSAVCAPRENPQMGGGHYFVFPANLVAPNPPTEGF